MTDVARSFQERLLRGEARGPMACAARAGLRALVPLYGAGLALHRGLYAVGLCRRQVLPAPVVSVGNIAAGGTGKTPMVEWVVRRLRQAGARPGVLSRGYRASAHGLADEPAVLAANLPDLPLGVGSDRAASGRALLREGRADCLVLDDGFQHWRLARDLDLVLVAADDPWAGGCLLPAGLLRESPAALARAQWVGIVGQADPRALDALKARLSVLAPQARLFRAERRPLGWSRMDRQGRLAGGDLAGSFHDLLPPDWVRGREVAAFCGLARPERFFRTLEDLGARLVWTRAYPDHHAYDVCDVEELYERAAGVQLVTTQKDAVKLADQARLGSAWTLVDEAAPDLAVLRIGMEVVEAAEDLGRALEDLWRRGAVRP